MNDAILKLYHHCPAPIRSLAASYRGLRIRTWRYGRETESLVEEALERETWSPERWGIWQQEKIARVLHRAATRVPYYRDQWSTRRQKGDKSSWERLESWPLLDKEAVRRNARAFVADDCNVYKMFLDQTGGTTGTPLTLWSSRKTMRTWHAIFEARARRWNELSRFFPWATLGGQPVVRGDAKQPPFWVWNAPMKHLYLSANHVSRANTPYFLTALKDYQIDHIVGYSSSLAVLAREILQLGGGRPSIKGIITMAEPLNSQQRDVIRAAFGCQVRETYGMSELVAMATECDSGTLHLWPEVGWVETFGDHEDRPLAAGSTGRLVCTSLMNTDMPLIRYIVGDRGRINSGDPSCGCGRNLPSILSIEGRTNDLLLTRDGREVYWLNPVFYGLPLIEAQIIQESLDTIRILYVPTISFTKEHQDLIATRLKLRFGEVDVRLEAVPAIPRASNGKFRAVVCNLSDRERISARKSSLPITVAQ